MQISDLQNLCDKMSSLREKIDCLDEEKKDLNKELMRLKSEAIEHLEEHGLSSFNYGTGKISVVERRSVSIIDKFEFFEWLKERGMFESVVSVPAPTAKKIYEEELLAAIDRKDIEFMNTGIKGLSEPKVHRDIRFLKA